jgi:ribonuclease P protein component
MQAPARKEAFRPGDRIRTPAEFKRVMTFGKRHPMPNFRARALPNGLAHSRLGLAVPRGYGSAVRRNRFKRLCREVFRLHRRALVPPHDVVLAPPMGASARREPVFDGIRRDFLTLAEVLKESSSRNLPS